MRATLIAISLVLSAVPAVSQSVSASADAEIGKLDLDYAHVMAVEAVRSASGWRFEVTVRHGDQGWNHYADRWIVVDAETGEEYGRRTLAHPHVSEQPFSRSQSGIDIPPGVDRVTVRAGCNRHDFGGTELTLSLR